MTGCTGWGFGLCHPHLSPLPSREMGIWLCWFVLLSAPPCGYCLEASMTAAMSPPLWIADQVRNDGEGRGNDGMWLFCLAITLTFDSSPIKGEGDSGFLSLQKNFVIFLKMYCDKFVICSKVI